MFKNRFLQVKVVKVDDLNGVMAPKSTDRIKEITQGTMAIVAVYMVADTLRKILVHVVATKVN